MKQELSSEPERVVKAVNGVSRKRVINILSSLRFLTKGNIEFAIKFSLYLTIIDLFL